MSRTQGGRPGLRIQFPIEMDKAEAHSEVYEGEIGRGTTCKTVEPPTPDRTASGGTRGLVG